MDQKYGRRASNRRSMGPKPQSPLGSRSSSPYGSGGENGEGRGRSMQRLSGSSPLASPRPGAGPGYGKATPLSRVTEEAAIPELADAYIQPEKLVEVETPRQSQDNKVPNVSAIPRVESDLLKVEEEPSPKANGKKPEVVDESMKTIEI